MIQVCRDTSDAVALYLPQRLYLKPFAKLNISVQLPPHKVHGKSISNWELMEKLRKMIQPDSFSVLKNTKHSPDVIRFDAELEQRDRLDRVLARLEGRIIQLNDYPDPLKVKVSEAKLDFPSRHSWDSFFRDAADMDEMKPGERPDTVHITYMPIRWFVHDKDRDDDAPPSESIVKKCFEKYGNIRQLDIPAADPFRMQMKSHMRGISIPTQESALYFETYIQFSEYVGFVRCMDALRGKKLLRKREDLAEWVSIQVDFDKTKHMTDASMKRRSIVRERLLARQRAKEDEERSEKEKQAKREAKERQKYEKAERDKLEKMREREQRRKKKQLAKLMEKDNLDLNSKVLEEQRRLLKAQKKLQAIRLIEELFKRIELRPELQQNGKHDNRHHSAGERSARARIVHRYKVQTEEALELQRQNLKSALEGRIVIRSALETKKPLRDSSASSISSDGRESRARDPRDYDRDPRDRDRDPRDYNRDPRDYDPRDDPRDHRYKRIKTEKLTTPEREMEYNKATGMFGMAGPFGYGYPFAHVPPHPGFPFQQTSMYYPVRGQYYPPPPEGSYQQPRRPYRGRGRGRGRPRMPYFEGPDASHQYYNRNTSTAGQRPPPRLSTTMGPAPPASKRLPRPSPGRRSTEWEACLHYVFQYFKRLTEQESRNEHDDRRSRSRSRRRSYSRSRSRSHRRSRSRSRRSRSRSRRTRSRSRRSRSRSHHSRSRSRRRSKSRSPRRSKSRSPRRANTKSPPKANSPPVAQTPAPRRSKSWSLPKDGAARQWSNSPKGN